MTDAKVGAGALFLSSTTGRVCLNLRAPYKTHNLTWSMWGGMMESGENPKTCLLREIEEEMGFMPDIDTIYPLDIYLSRDRKFKYYSFIAVVEDEFIPKLNKESVGYCWVDMGIWPRPLHKGASSTLLNKKTLEKLTFILGQYQN